MLSISLKKDDHMKLSEGAVVKINGEHVVLTREDDYLVYTDGEGSEHRCKILEEIPSAGLVTFFAATHGMEDLPHFVLGVPGKGVSQ